MKKIHSCKALAAGMIPPTSHFEQAGQGLASAQQHLQGVREGVGKAGGHVIDGLLQLVHILKTPTGGYHFFLSHKQSTSYAKDADGKKTSQVLAPSAGDGQGLFYDYTSTTIVHFSAQLTAVVSPKRRLKTLKRALNCKLLCP